jgi:outer membrane protein
MKHILLKIITGVFAICLTLNVQAQVPVKTEAPVQKIGTANVEFIISNLPEAKKMESDLMAYEKQLRTQLESKGAEYQRKLEEYQRGVQSGVMPPSVIADKEKELMSMQQSIQEFERTAQEDLESKQMSMLDPILTKVQAAIDKVAAANDFTYIISTHVDFGGSAIILYSKYKEANDISVLVLKELGVVLPAPGTTNTTTTPAPAPTNTTNPTIPVKSTTPVKK